MNTNIKPIPDDMHSLTPHLVCRDHLYVENADATIEQAVTAGARVTMPAEDMFWGDRYGRLVDPFGHEWSIATHLQDLSPEEIQVNMKNACPDA